MIKWSLLLSSYPLSPSQELHYYILPESERHPPIVLPPPNDVLVRVSPQKVTQQTCVWYVCSTAIEIEYNEDLRRVESGIHKVLISSISAVCDVI